MDQVVLLVFGFTRCVNVLYEKTENIRKKGSIDR